MVCNDLAVWTIYSQNSKCATIGRILSFLMPGGTTVKRTPTEDIYWGGKNREINDKNTKENSDHSVGSLP